MKIYTLSIFLIIASLIFGQEKLTLTDAIERGLENNYGLRISKMNLEISNENNSWGAAGLYPTIDISISSINRVDHDIDNDTDVETKNISPSATLGWVLFNGFKIYNTKSKLNTQYELAKGANSISVENTIRSIILQYYDVLLKREQMNVFKELAELSKDRYERTQTSSEIGGAITFDVLQAKTAWLEDRSNFLTQKLNYENSIRALNLLLGEKKDILYSELDDFSIDIKEYNFEVLESKMLSKNKSLKNQYLNEIISQKDIELARGGMYPKLILNAGYDYLNSKRQINSLPSTTSKSYDYYGNLTLSLNLFDGLNTKRQLEIAKIQSDISKIETEEIKHSLRNSLKQLLELYNIQKDLLIVAKENLEASKLNLQIAEEKFKNGAINSFNYRDAQIVYLNASLQKLNSIYNLLSTDTELARITGSIVSEE